MINGIWTGDYLDQFQGRNNWHAEKHSGGAPPPVPAPVPVVKVPGEGSQIPACAQEVVLYTNNNSGGVSSGPTQPTRFTLNTAARISSLLTYHWNDGRGQPPGSISLVHQDGTRYGPWTASGTPGSGNVPNAYWTVRPDVVVQPGIYTVGDSHAASWAQNAQSNSEGIVQVKGCGGR
jgi:hypothetical protein